MVNDPKVGIQLPPEVDGEDMFLELAVELSLKCREQAERIAELEAQLAKDAPRVVGHQLWREGKDYWGAVVYEWVRRIRERRSRSSLTNEAIARNFRVKFKVPFPRKALDAYCKRHKLENPLRRNNVD